MNDLRVINPEETKFSVKLIGDHFKSILPKINGESPSWGLSAPLYFPGSKDCYIELETVTSEGIYRVNIPVTKLSNVESADNYTLEKIETKGLKYRGWFNIFTEDFEDKLFCGDWEDIENFPSEE